MANGKTHARGTSTTLIVVITVVSVAFVSRYMPGAIPLLRQHWVEAAMVVSGLFVGHYATPDVRDQQKNRNHGEKMVEDHFGKIAGVLWSAWWEPLARVIPHRSPLSHLPGLATAIAAVWLYWLPVAAWLYTGGIVDWRLMACHVAGWAVQDAVHLWQDKGGIRW